MAEHHVTIRGGPVESADQVDLIHTAVETAAGGMINTSTLEWHEDCKEVTVHLWLDAPSMDAAVEATRGIADVIMFPSKEGV